MPSDLDARLGKVRLAAFDVDGVLTDGRFLLDGEGRDAVQFHTRDGLGLKLLLRAGVSVALITGRSSKATAERGRMLGVPHVRLGVGDKAEVLREIARAENVQPEEILYLGDDLPDLPAMAFAGVPAAVADAAPEVREQAALVTERPGGHGAAREVAERILAARGRWSESIARATGEASE